MDNTLFNFFVYSKDLEETEDYKRLDNIGRESHTYLHHIITNFDNLPDYIIFTQGDPFPHCHNFLYQIKSLDYSSVKSFYPFYGRQWGGFLESDMEGRPHHFGINLKPYQEYLDVSKETLTFTPGAIFVLTKSAILEKGIEFFRTLYEYHFTDNDFPWIIERYWGEIFKYDFENHKYY